MLKNKPFHTNVPFLGKANFLLNKQQVFYKLIKKLSFLLSLQQNYSFNYFHLVTKTFLKFRIIYEFCSMKS